MTASFRVTRSAEFRQDDDDQLETGEELLDFLGNLPDGIKLAPIYVQKGSQRDPWELLVGLRATWEES